MNAIAQLAGSLFSKAHGTVPFTLKAGHLDNPS